MCNLAILACRVALVACLLALAPVAGAAGTLTVYFIDVEGGQATLLITPEGESLLIDAGYGARGGQPPRDAPRILAAARDAGLTRIDYLLVTHFHNDHVGGVPDLVAQIPVGTFIDYGQPLGTDRLTGAFRAYEPVRAAARHLQPAPGDRLPLRGVEAVVVSTGGFLLDTPLPGGGLANPACSTVEEHVEDGTENYRSVGVLVRFGAFGFLDVGDLSGNTLPKLVCPVNLLGPVPVYLVAHHGDYDANVPALYAAIRPRVAVMNNGVLKGASPDALRTALAQPGMDLWQLHASRSPGAVNAAESLVANVDGGETSYWLKLTATDDGGFELVNTRTGTTRSYPAP